MMANLNLQFTMYRRFFNVNTGNAIKIFDVDLKVTRAVPEKHIINFFSGRSYIKFGQTMSAISREQNSQIWSNKYQLLSTLNPGRGIVGSKLTGGLLIQSLTSFGLLLENSLDKHNKKINIICIIRYMKMMIQVNTLHFLKNKV